MKTIQLAEQSIYQIKNILLGDETIRKLLYIQAPDALTSATSVTTAMVDNLISVVPYLQDDDGIENSAQSNFLVIYMPYVSLKDDQMHMVSVNIDIFVYKDYYLLNGSKVRILQLLNKIVDLLDDKKLAFAEKFQIDDARLTNIDQGKTIGYLTSWSAVNGTTDISY
jgi:hypothetical protein